MRMLWIATALMAPLPAFSAGWTCKFSELCTGGTCEDLEAPIAAQLAPISGSTHLHLSIIGERETARLAPLSTADAALTTYVSGDFDDGALLLTIHEDGKAAMTVHLSVFGLAYSTATGSCREDG